MTSIWPQDGVTRIPYTLYRDEKIYAEERERIFKGPAWHFLCLEVELPDPGDYRATHVGDIPVVVARTKAGAFSAFENRCAHRGALICHKRQGHGERLACVYHAWTYDLEGQLKSVTFQRGVNGDGGMPGDFRIEEHHRRRLRVESYAGILFGTFSAEASALADYIGPEIGSWIKRVMARPIKVLGYASQILANNWKIYAGNVKDPYHASLLHLFYTAFKMNRLSQEGGIIIDPTGAHHVSYSKMATDRFSADYEAADLRVKSDDYRLRDPSILKGRDEFGDGITLQILTVFPMFILQQIQNSLAVRQLVLRGTGETELLWTYFGFADDDADMDRQRLIQANLAGPGGYISMEDGAVGSFIQRALPGAEHDTEIIEMGGRDWVSQTTRATESPLRGFWHNYRALMQL